MASWAPVVPIDGDCVPVLVLGRSLVVPGPIPLELLPGLSDCCAGLSDCCASTRGAATKTTARANMMVLLSLLIMDILLFLHYTLLHLPGSPPRLHCLTPC